MAIAQTTSRRSRDWSETAAKLLARYQSVENLLEHTNELKGKQKEQIESHAEQAKLSKVLATINQAVPIDYQWSALALQSPSNEALSALFSELEFRTLGKRLFGDRYQHAGDREAEANFTLSGELSPDAQIKPHATAQEQQAEETAPVAIEENSATLKHLDKTQVRYQLIKEDSDLKSLIQAIERSQCFAFDTETGLSTHKSQTSRGLPLSPKKTKVGFCLINPSTIPSSRHYLPIQTLQKLVITWNMIYPYYKTTGLM